MSVLDHGVIRRLRSGSVVALLAALVGVLPVLAQLSIARHETTVQHVLCAEHGELTHVMAAVSASPPARNREAGALADDLSGSEGGHEHCTTASDLVTADSSARARTAARLALPPTRPRPPIFVSPRAGRDVVLASAPKTSPPRRG